MNAADQPFSASGLRQNCYNFYLGNSEIRFAYSRDPNQGAQPVSNSSDLKFNKMARHYFLEQKLEEAEEDMEEEEEENRESQDNSGSENDSSNDEDEKSEKFKKKKKQRKIDIIKYFDPFREILGPDELLEFKGVHTKIGLNTSKLTNMYGRLKPKVTDPISHSIYQADLGGERRFKQNAKQMRPLREKPRQNLHGIKNFPINNDPQFIFKDACAKLFPFEHTQLLYEYDQYEGNSEMQQSDNLGVRDDAGVRYLMRMKIIQDQINQQKQSAIATPSQGSKKAKSQTRRQTALIGNLNNKILEQNVNQRDIQSQPTEKAVEIDLVDIRIDNVKFNYKSQTKVIATKKRKQEREIDDFLDRQCNNLFQKSN